MCCLFGFVDYGHKLTLKQRNRLLTILATACEARGTDATGISYNVGNRLKVSKSTFYRLAANQKKEANKSNE